eukprot:jgi/Botrbrau1/17951/Bobra.50_1s0045.3
MGDRGRGRGRGGGYQDRGGGRGGGGYQDRGGGRGGGGYQGGGGARGGGGSSGARGRQSEPRVGASVCQVTKIEVVEPAAALKDGEVQAREYAREDALLVEQRVTTVEERIKDTGLPHIPFFNPEVKKKFKDPTAEKPRGSAEKPRGSAGKPLDEPGPVVTVNHFKVAVDLDSQVTQYSLVVRRQEDKGTGGPPTDLVVLDRIPDDVFTSLINHVAKEEGWTPGMWVSDGSKTLFTAPNYVFRDSITKRVEIAKGKKGKDIYMLEVKHAKDLHLSALKEFLEGDSPDARRTSPDAQYITELNPGTITEVLRALDVVLKAKAADNGFVNIGRAMYMQKAKRDTPPVNLGGGAQLWFGLQCSVRPAVSMLTLNADTSAIAVYPPGPALDIIRGVDAKSRNPGQAFREFESGNLRGQNLATASRAFRGLKVRAKYGSKRQYVLDGLAEENSLHMFESKIDGKVQKLTVAAYFQSTHNYKIVYPKGNCAKVRNKQSVLLPLELLDVVPKMRVMKLDSEQSRNMVDQAAQHPTVRKAHIESTLEQLLAPPEKGKFDVLKNFKLQIQNKMLIVPAKQYANPPKIVYKKLNPKTARLDNHECTVGTVGKPGSSPGTWNLTQNPKFFAGASCKSYAIAAFGVYDNDKSNLEGCFEEMFKSFGKYGTMLPQGVAVKTLIAYDDSQPLVDALLDAAVKRAKDAFRLKEQDLPEIIFVVLPDTGAALYEEVKRQADSRLGIISQCLVISKFTKAAGFPQYCANVALKVNAKLGGTNHILDSPSYGVGWNVAKEKNMPFILIGADVTHPSSLKDPSIAAVCCSTNADLSRFAAKVRMQAPRVEIISVCPCSFDWILTPSL